MTDDALDPAVDLEALTEVMARFAVPGQVTSAERQAGGHIHDSFRVEVQTGRQRRRFLLQTMNDHVFPDPPAVMQNIEAVSRHLRRVLTREGALDSARRVLTLVPPASGALCLTDDAGQWWRLFQFVEGTASTTTVSGPDQAHAAASAYGAFARRLSDFDPSALHETIPRFHDTAWRLQQLEAVAQADRVGRLADCADDVAFCREHASLTQVLPALTAAGELPVHAVHNDAKPANVLFDVTTGEGLCVIDLDTVMPGSALHDFGDLVRSMTSSAGEDRTAEAGVDVDLPVFDAVARGWLSEFGEHLTPAEREHLVFAGLLITFEQGVRFLADHLDGDRYFRIPAEGHNLRRARNQLALARALQARRSELERLVATL